MNLEIISKNFDLILNAPGSVPKLREWILQLAVQGKLVPQDPNDEPASELVKQVKVEKDKLFSEGKIKKEKPLTPISENEIPYILPNGWDWFKLGELGSTNIGLTYSPNDISEKGIPVLRSNNIRKGKIDLNNLVRVNKKINDNLYLQQGDILICARNGSKALVGKAAQIKELPEKTVFGAFMAIFRSRYNNYIEVFLNSPIFRKFLDDVSTTTINQITQSNLINTLIPLPPLQEQKRIVSRVEQLMKLCDELEQQQKQVQEKRINFNLSATYHLANAENQADFNKYLQIINDNFDYLYDEPKNIAKLRETILQLAVQGKLVKQDPNDEHASELLKRIKNAKEKLISSGKIKNEQPLLPVNQDEIPYLIPEIWEWTKWENVSEKIGDIDHDMPKEVTEGYPYISPRDFTDDGNIDFKNAKKISEEDFLKLSRKITPKRFDIIFPRYGTIGVNRLVDTDIDFLASYSCAVIKTFKNLTEPKYIFYYSISLLAKYQIKKYTNTTTQPNVGLKSIKEFLIPLPPLAEQKRIVDRVEQLMKLCDELESAIEKSRKENNLLLESVLKNSLNLPEKELIKVANLV
jgi:type I restriction enzyme S subunit